MVAQVQQIKNGQELPDWVKVGEEVAVIGRHYSGQTATIRRVDKVTATQVVVEGERYSIKRGLEKIGQRNAWASTPFLADPASKEVKAVLLRARVATAKFQVDRANDAFQKDPSVTTARSLMLSVELWQRCQQDLTDATVKQA